MTKPYIAAFALLLSASPALSAACAFTSECFDGEGCSETSFSMTLEQSGGEVLMTTDAETIPLSQGGNTATQIYVGITENAFHLLTVTEAGPSRYTTHIYDGPLAVTYLGECSE